MHPQLFRLFDTGFPAYFVLLLTGFLFATALTSIGARRMGGDPDVIVDLGIAMLLFGVAGARILHVLADGHFMDYVHACTDPSLVDWPLTERECVSPVYQGVWDAKRGTCHPGSVDCFAWAKFWAGGLTYYGGFIGASIAGFYLLKKDRFRFFRAADLAGASIPLGLAFGRMGCLLAGCCFGRTSESAMALSFPPRSPATETQVKAHLLASVDLPSLKVLPTQIFESAGSLALAAICLFVVGPRKRYEGAVFVTFLAGYAILRFVLEFFRDDDRGGLLALSTSQLIGIPLVALAVLIHRKRSRGEWGNLYPTDATV